MTTVHVATRFVPSFVLAVIVVVPLATAVTTPLLLTVATLVLLLVHVTLPSVTLEGITVAVSVTVCPAVVSVTFVLSSEIFVAKMGMLTVTLQVALRFVPSFVVAVIVAVPLATAVTTPVLLTVATLLLLLDQVTLPSSTLAGSTVAVSVEVSPADVSVRLVLFSVTLVASTGENTAFTSRLLEGIVQV